MTTTVILQPSYIPWIGYFEQILKSDIFVFYDDVQYTKNDWRNRNKIKTPQGTAWLSIPVQFKLGDKINEIKITSDWKEKHLKTIRNFYKKSIYFDEVYPIFEKELNKKHSSLSDLDIDIIKSLSNYLGLKAKFYKSSELNIGGDKNNRLINICKHFDTTHYLSGKAAQSYLDIDLFDSNNITVEYQNFIHKPYTQLYGEFIPYLSILDLLFNCGKASLKVIQNVDTKH